MIRYPKESDVLKPYAYVLNGHHLDACVWTNRLVSENVMKTTPKIPKGYQEWLMRQKRMAYRRPYRESNKDPFNGPGFMDVTNLPYAVKDRD